MVELALSISVFSISGLNAPRRNPEGVERLQAEQNQNHATRETLDTHLWAFARPHATTSSTCC